MPMYETQLKDGCFTGVSCGFCASLMASHLIDGQTNYYITVSQPVVNQVTNDL